MTTPSIETKGLPAGAELKLDDAGHLTVAFAKLDAVDTDADYTFPGAFEPTDVPISAFNHASWPHKGGLPPTGRGSVKEAGGWAVFDGEFFMKTAHGRDAYETVKGMGELQQWSYGYQVLELADPPKGTKARRGLKSVLPYEISPVLMGAQPLAHTVAIKGEKGAITNISDAYYALAGVLRILQTEAASEGEVDGLRSIAEQLGQYITAAIGDVGTPEDQAQLANEAAARVAMGYSSSSLLPDGPLAGLKFEDESTRLLSALDRFGKRLVAVQAIRLKEGRAISTARMELLQGHLAALTAASATLQEMIDSAQPAKEPDEAKARLMRITAQLGSAGVEFASLRS